MHVGIAVHCYLVFIKERTTYIPLKFDVNLYFSHCFNKVFYTPEYQNEFNSFKQRKTNFIVFLRKRISPEQIIQRNWGYKIQVFKIAAKAEKDKTQKQSRRMKNNLNRCVLAF